MTNKKYLKESVSCVMPFYNEDLLNIIENVRELLNVRELDKIILVDDGSDDISEYELLQSIFEGEQRVLVTRLVKNFGKSFAVFFGLSYVTTDNVLLCDSDLTKLNSEQVSDAIIRYQMLDLDMLILRRMKMSICAKILRSDTLLSGERITKKAYLDDVFNKTIKKYQLELAVNQYFIDNKLAKNCFWSPSDAVNFYKFKKISLLRGLFKDLKMYCNIISHVGFFNYVRQVFTFCKEDV
jgi:glycosyltransferase involved in cell wall biosynthesis